MTHYGLNPSFVYGRLPLLSDPIRRGRRFEVFNEDGTPTGKESSIDPDGWPALDGQRHGVRLFADMDGHLPEIGVEGLSAVDGAPTFLLKIKDGQSAYLSWPSGGRCPVKLRLARRPPVKAFDIESLTALGFLRPKVLRTLDWQMTNKRPDWSKPRVLPLDPLQGTDRGMAVELQAEAANLLQCALWWCAPPRFELSVAEYESRLEEYLVAIKQTARRAPILEYGNELWNGGFPVHGWLQSSTEPEPRQAGTWHLAAAREIACLKRVADRVFGAPGVLGQKPYYLFVGGQLAVPSHLDRILSALADLGVTPDLAGPALYVTPLKAQKEEWEATGAVPTQDELRASCFARLWEIETGTTSLATQVRLVRSHKVPFFACYEAGQSLLSGAHPWRKAAIEAQRTEWMGNLYREIRSVAEAAGVDLLNWYSACTDQAPGDPRVDVFGLLEHDDADDVLPKALAAS